MFNFQMIPLSALLVYFLYLSYYIAAPMFFLRVLLLIAYKKYRCREIRFTEDAITVTLTRDGEEHRMVRPLGVELESRFFPMTACSVMRGILKDLRNGAVE